MEEQFNEQINKQYYKMIIEKIGQDIINRADDILNDWDKGIKQINISANICGGCVPTISVQKEYLPKEIR